RWPRDWSSDVCSSDLDNASRPGLAVSFAFHSACDALDCYQSDQEQHEVYRHEITKIVVRVDARTEIGSAKELDAVHRWHEQRQVLNALRKPIHHEEHS